MAESPSGKRGAARKRPTRKPSAGGLVSGDVYEDYLRGVAKAQTLPPTIPGLSCPPFTVPAAQCQPARGVESAAGFPTIPLKHCVRTIPGLNCPVETVPLVKCLPDGPAGGTIPIVGCPKTIPGVTCEVPTVPVLGCVPEHAEADIAAPVTLIPTVIPPCPTIPGPSCPVPTIPILSCVPGGDGGRTLPVVGCPATIPGITCPLPTLPVLRCLPHLAAPPADAVAQSARAALDAPEAVAFPTRTITVVGPACWTVLSGCRTIPWCPTYPPSCGTLPEQGAARLAGPVTDPGAAAVPFTFFCFSMVVRCPPTIRRCPPTSPPLCRTPLFEPPPVPGVAGSTGDDQLGAFPPFPTIPVAGCVKTIPGVTCPVPTVPLRGCIEIDTIPVVGCPPSIPGLICEIETIPLVRCIGDEVPDEPEIRTIVPPCPTVPGVTCPIRTIPIRTCLPGPEALSEAKEADRLAAATLRFIGCPPTIPGVTCDLPTVPVVDCLEFPPEPPPPPPPATMPRVTCPVTVLPPECPITWIQICPAPTLERGAGPTIVPTWCVTQPDVLAYGAPMAAARVAAAPTNPPGCAVGSQAAITLITLFPCTLTCPTLLLPCPTINTPCPSINAPCTLLNLCPVEPEDPRGLAARAAGPGGAAAPTEWPCGVAPARPITEPPGCGVAPAAAFTYPACPTFPPDCDVTHPPMCQPHTRWCAPGAGMAAARPVTEPPGCGIAAPITVNWWCGTEAVKVAGTQPVIGCPPTVEPSACRAPAAVAADPGAQAAVITLFPCLTFVIPCPSITTRCPTIHTPCPTLTEQCLSIPCSMPWLCGPEPEGPAQLAAGPAPQAAAAPITLTVPFVICTIAPPAIPPTIYEIYCYWR